MNIKYLSIFIILSVLLSCKSKLEKEMDGIWVLEDIVFLKDVNYSYAITANIFNFESNYSLSVPSTRPNLDIKGTWEVVNSSLSNPSIHLNIDNELFSGVYSIKILEESPKFTVLLENDTLMLTISRVLQVKK